MYTRKILQRNRWQNSGGKIHRENKFLCFKCIKMDKNFALCNDCITCPLNKPIPHQKQLAEKEKQDSEGQNLYCNHHRTSFDTKGPISPSSEGSSFIMVIVDAFPHYVALKPTPHFNSYYAYTKFITTRNPCHRQWHRNHE